MDKPTCETCPFWDMLYDDSGYCKVNGPVMNDKQTCVVWPRTQPGDFCGRHPDFPSYLAKRPPID